MKTDYNNLKLIDGLAVFFVAAGIVLIGVLGFNGLSPEDRNHVAQAVQVLDMHEELDRQAKALTFWLVDAPDYALSNFYVAFTEVATVPYETIAFWADLGQRTQTSFYNLSDTLVVAYQQNFIDSSREAIMLAQSREGSVLGISDTRQYDTTESNIVVLENLIPPNLSEPPIKISDDPRMRGYRAPDLQNIFEKIKLMEE
jgi:hypothetical protein